MPVELQIIRASEFVRLTAHGHVDFEGSTKILKDLAAACRKRGVNLALLDLRGLPTPDKPVFTPSELAALVAAFRHAGFSHGQRLAVLYRNDPHYGARMFAFISRLRGLKVRAFPDFEASLLWLSGDENNPAPKGPTETPIRIMRRKVKVKFPKSSVAKDG